MYQASCLTCCVDLVLSTRPNKQAAGAMLQLIERQRHFSRKEVLDLMKERMCQKHGLCQQEEKSNG